jgi:hypothetical protein
VTVTSVRLLRDYFILEARHTLRQAPLAMAIGCVLAILGTHEMLVRFPGNVLRFLERAFAVEGIAAVLLVNDLVAAYFATFFVGITGLLERIVASREEHRLEILLAKPIPPRTFLAARVGPILASAATVGVLVSFTTALAIRPYLAAQDDMVTTAGAFGGSLFLVALALVLLAALVPLLVTLNDSFHGLLVASVVWVTPVIPAAFFIYRPDLFEHHELVRSTLVLATLVWHAETSAWLGPIALALAPLACGALVMLGGRLLERTDVGG